MPHTGDATGTFDPNQAAQDVYRAFQDNGVPILGLCRTTVDPGPPPTVNIDVNLANGSPVATDPNTLPEGESLPPADGSLSISLTQFNNSVGGYSWVASGTVTRSNGDTQTATSTPGTGGLTSQDLNDPDRADEWNRSLPQSAYDAVERVKRKLGIHAGRVQAAIPPGRAIPRRRFRRNRVAAAGAVAGAALGLIAGLVATAALAGTPAPTSSTASGGHAAPAPSGPAVNTLKLDRTGKVDMAAIQPVCSGWPQSGTYGLEIKTDASAFSMSIDGAAPATGTIGADGRYTAQNAFYKAAGQLKLTPRTSGALAGGQLVAFLDDPSASGQDVTDKFRIDYVEGSATCSYQATAAFPGTVSGSTPAPTAAPTPAAKSDGGTTLPWLPFVLALVGAIFGAGTLYTLTGVDDSEGELVQGVFVKGGGDGCNFPLADYFYGPELGSRPYSPPPPTDVPETAPVPIDDVIPIQGNSGVPPPDEVM